MGAAHEAAPISFCGGDRVTTPALPPAETIILPATERYCQSLTRFGLTPTQCYAGVGRKYNAALVRLLGQRMGVRSHG